MRIVKLSAYQVYDSRGNPTIEAEVVLADGSRGRGIVPSGMSTGQFEASELRDHDPTRFRGRSVFQAIENIQSILGPALMEKESLEQRQLDQCMIELDGTSEKSRLGANSILAVSMAFANAASASLGIPLHAYLGPYTLLPLPEIQIFGGGAHANWRIDVQDFMIVAISATTFDQVMEMTHNIFVATGDLLREKSRLSGVADEGGFWPELESNEEAFDIVLSGIERAGYVPGRDVGLSLDIAASNLYDQDSQKYLFRSENRSFERQAFAELLLGWCRQYPVVSIEDPVADSDWEGWRQFRAAVPQHLQLVGDDIFTTNLERIRKGVEQDVANAVLIKLNQVGTVSETLDAISLARSSGWSAIISARSGETEDTFISHLAVGTGAGQLKVGSFARSERVAKWNEIVRIGRYLGTQAAFLGAGVMI